MVPAMTTEAKATKKAIREKNHVAPHEIVEINSYGWSNSHGEVIAQSIETDTFIAATQKRSTSMAQVLLATVTAPKGPP